MTGGRRNRERAIPSLSRPETNQRKRAVNRKDRKAARAELRRSS